MLKWPLLAHLVGSPGLIAPALHYPAECGLKGACKLWMWTSLCQPSRAQLLILELAVTQASHSKDEVS